MRSTVVARPGVAVDTLEDGVERRAPRGADAEGGEPHAAREALEEPAADAALEPRDIAGQRRLGDGEAFGGRGDASRLGDGKALEADEVGSLLEHGDVPRWWGGRPHVPYRYLRGGLRAL